MSYFDPGELAGIRAAVIETMTDTAYILRVASEAVSEAAGNAPGYLSNGAGGVRQVLATQAANTPQQQYAPLGASTPIGDPIPCRLGSYTRGMGEFLLSGVGAEQAKTSFKLKLPYDTVVYETDRMHVVTDVDDFVYEVTAIEPKSDQFSRAVRLTRIE